VTSRKDIVREYKERRKPAGIYQIKNTVNGRFLLGSSINLEGVLNSQRFKLSAGMHPNKVLQQEWNTFGTDKFSFKILESVQKNNDPCFSVEDELTLLKQIWLEKLRDDGSEDYNMSVHPLEA